MRTAGSNQLWGELRAVNCAPGSPSLDWTLSSTRANVRRCRRIQGLAGTSFWTVWTSPAYGGSGSKPLGLLLQARSRAFSCAVFLLHERQCRTHGGLSAATRRALAAMANETPSSGAPAGSVSAGTHLVREWNGRTYQVEVLDKRLSVRWQNLSVPHGHHKANHRHPLVRTTLFRPDAQAQGLT